MITSVTENTISLSWEIPSMLNMYYQVSYVIKETYKYIIYQLNYIYVVSCVLFCEYI